VPEPNIFMEWGRNDDDLQYCVTINKRIFNYPDAWLAAFSTEISDIKKSRTQDGAAASLWQATTPELSRTNHRAFDNNNKFSILLYQNRKHYLLLEENRDSVRTTCIHSMLAAILELAVFLHHSNVNTSHSCACAYLNSSLKIVKSLSRVLSKFSG